MAYFRKVDPRIWTDRRFRALPERAQLLFLYLLTHPKMTLAGVLMNTAGGIAEERGWERREVIAMLAGMKGMVEYDPDAQAFWFPNWLRYQPLENPNCAKAAIAVVEALHDGPLRNSICAMLVPHLSERFKHVLAKSSLNGWRNPLANGSGNGLANRLPKGMPNKEMEMEMEKELEIEMEGVQGEGEQIGAGEAVGPLGPAGACPREEQPEKTKPVRTHPFTDIVFPVSGGKTWRMDDALANQLTIAYPKLDVGQELDRAKAWLLSNPGRMKTSRGMGRFVGNWMSTADTKRQLVVAAGAKAQPERSYRGENDPTIDWWAGAEEHKAALEEAMRLEEAAGQ